MSASSERRCAVGPSQRCESAQQVWLSTSSSACCSNCSGRMRGGGGRGRGERERETERHRDRDAEREKEKCEESIR